MEKHQIEAFYRMVTKWENESAALRVITTHYIPVNTWLIKYLGLDAALFLSAAYEELFYLRQIGKVKDDDFAVKFSVRKAQMKTGLGEARQRKAIDVLKSHGLIGTYNTGWVPSYRNIAFNFAVFKSFEQELNDFINKETIKNKKIKEEFDKKMKDVHDDCVNKKIKEQKEFELDFEKCAEEQRLAEQKAIEEWETEHPGEDYYEAHRIQTDACYAAPPTQPARSFNGFTF